MSKREAALEAFLRLVAERGFAAVALRDVAAAAEMSLSDLHRLYPDKAALIASFIGHIDSEVLAGTHASGDPEETARDRLFDVMMRRYDALKARRPAWREIRKAMLRDPILALSLAPTVRRSMAAMLEAAGIPSEGFPGAVRQNGLAAIHFDVSRTFGDDDSSDLSKTMAALDGRLKRAERWAQSVEKYTDFRRPKRREQEVETPTS
ncbi:MAG TPA: TetR family transcriptional regulator [Reyranella sp.]|jgi:AcrR family transcriptional regulator|nr:TetR family transcriptional regulator [Reyranella sp.]